MSISKTALYKGETPQRKGAYEVVVNHNSDLLTQDLILTGIFLHTRFKEYGCSFDFPHIKYEHASGNVFYPIREIEELRANVFSLEQFENLRQFLEKELFDYKAFLTEFEKHLDAGENKEARVKEFFREALKSAGTIPYFAFELGLHKLLQEKNIPIDAIPSAVTDTTQASHELETLTKKYASELSLLKTAEKHALSLALKNDLDLFCKRFGYLGMKYFLGHPWTTTEAFRMLLSVPAHTATATTPAPPLSTSPYVKIAAELLRLRTLKWEFNCYGTYLLREFVLKHYAREVCYEDLLTLRLKEVRDMLCGFYPVRDAGSERKTFTLDITDKGVLFSTAVETDMDIGSETRVTEVTGLVAQRGKVVGKAKIVLTPKDGGKVEAGDILVTAMPTPDFLPAMRRAAAFVTDIGDITSHAAIISREMQKPCIIGTKNATKVFRDGDVIEVDGEKGIIRILKRN